MLIISLIFLISCKALPFIHNQLSINYYQRLSSILLLFTSFLTFNTLDITGSFSSGLGIYGGLFNVNLINQIIEIVLLITSSFILLGWPIKSSGNHSINYSILVIFCILGASLLISSSDLLSLYLSIELQSFSLYILSTLYKESTSAGLKYFLIGCLASSLILLGSGLIYSATGLTNFESIYNLISVSTTDGFNLGIIIVFIGFLIKIAAAPLHNWSPDVYDETPTIVTIWLTIIPKISILILLLELYTHSSNLPLKYLLLTISLISLIIGSVVGLVQKKIKRLLAYSTISHLGFIILSLAINTEQSIESFLFYIIQYSLTNLNIFLILIALSYLNKKDITLLSELKGQFIHNPLLSLSFSICLFSLSGVPPLLGFYSKQLVLLSSLQSGYYFISLVGILVSVISASYYLKIIKIIYSDWNIEKNIPQINLSNFHSYLISSLTLFILLFILKPSLILNNTLLLSLILFKF